MFPSYNRNINTKRVKNKENVTKSVDTERDKAYYDVSKGKEVQRLIDAKEIGRRLNTLRGDRSREEVAAALGISVSAISMYENGERVPRDDVKIKLAELYKKSVQEIFFDY